ncbi:hypothetical protein BKA81DRAFT_406654 [Phyllosticta paracitricarpa]
MEVLPGGFHIDVNNMPEDFVYALQLLFIASPEILSEIADPCKEAPWTVDEIHPHIKLLPDSLFDEDRDILSLREAVRICWAVVAEGALFQGRTGLLQHTKDYDATPRTLPDDYHPKFCDIYLQESFQDWQSLFDNCLGPKDPQLPGIESLKSIQTFFMPESFPAYLTISSESKVDEDVAKLISSSRFAEKTTF